MDISFVEYFGAGAITVMLFTAIIVFIVNKIEAKFMQL